MKVIYKYPLQVRDEQSITVRKGSELLDIQYQINSGYGSSIMAWFLEDANEKEYEDRVFQIFGTGVFGITDNDLQYLRTVQAETYVWHIFERKVPTGS